MLKNIYQLNFEIILTTGLHIGGSSDTFDIGGADSTVIKNPLSQEPYIPGSSIKGKIRTLLTYKYGEIKDNNYVISDNTIRNLFENVDQDNSVSVSRAIFRDAYLTKQSSNEIQKKLGTGVFTEIKAENKIDILKGKAANPRFIERVPAGAIFSGEIILQVFDGDDSEKLKKGILEGLRLLQTNYLGGNGSRGYGRVKILENGFTKVDI